MKKYSIDQIDNIQAEYLWRTSSMAKVFTQPNVLSKLTSGKVDWWLYRDQYKNILLWPVCLDKSGNPYQPAFSYWVGPMWLIDRNEIPAHRLLSVDVAVYEPFIDFLLNKYGRIDASLVPDITDIRVFDWWNYHNPEKGRFTLTPKYTAVINEIDDKSNLYSTFRELRKRQIKKAQGLSDKFVRTKFLSEEIVFLYTETFKNQDKVVDQDAIRTITKLFELEKSNFLHTVGFREKISGKLISGEILLISNGTANLLINVVDHAWRNAGLMPFTTYTAITESISIGCNKFDFNGANSPNRGDDKHSYGSTPVLYFDIKF